MSGDSLANPPKLKPRDNRQNDNKAMCAWGDISSSAGDSDSELESRYKNLGSKDICLMTAEGSTTSEVSSSSNISLSSNTMSSSGLLDLIRQLVSANNELRNTIAEKDARLKEMVEESHQKTICIRRLENQLENSQKPTQRLVVQEPSHKKMTDSRRKEPRHGLGYGKVTILQRPEKVIEPCTTPRPKVDLEGDAKVYGKGFQIWNKIANGGQSKVVDYNKQTRKAAEWKNMNFKKMKVCYHCGGEGHLWKDCPGRKSQRSISKVTKNKVRKAPAPRNKAKVLTPSVKKKVPEPRRASAPQKKAKVPTPSVKKKVPEPSKADKSVRLRGNPFHRTNFFTDHTLSKCSNLCITPKTTKLVWVPKH